MLHGFLPSIRHTLWLGTNSSYNYHRYYSYPCCIRWKRVCVQ